VLTSYFAKVIFFWSPIIVSQYASRTELLSLAR